MTHVGQIGLWMATASKLTFASLLASLGVLGTLGRELLQSPNLVPPFIQASYILYELWARKNNF